LKFLEELDVKKLKGRCKGFYRMQSGEIRIIFALDIKNKTLLIYNSKHRRKVYR